MFFGNNEDVAKYRSIPDYKEDYSLRCAWCDDEIVGDDEEYLGEHYHPDCLLAAIERNM